MTTYLLLALTDDGRVTAYRAPSNWSVTQIDASVHQCPNDAPEVKPARSGTDRNAYSTYEIAGYSIDVMKLDSKAR